MEENEQTTASRENGRGATGNFKTSVFCCSGYLARMADMCLLFVDPMRTQKAK